MTTTRYYRKIIKVTAEDSPNVKLGLRQRALGMEPTGETVLDGVLSWDDYVKRRATWDRIQQCVSLDAMFYEGAEVKLFPGEWLALARRRALDLKSVGKKRQATGIGIDPAEGGDKTAMCAGDDLGVIDLVSRKTPDTNDVVGEAVAFMQYHGCPPDRVYFDRGGGGKQHADRMRAMGYPVRTVAFGETVGAEMHRGLSQFSERLDTKEDRCAYKNRRAEMYHEARQLLDPSLHPDGYGVPGAETSDVFGELHRQLAVFPLLHNEEGVIYLPPKNKKDPDQKVVTLFDLLGRSPDEADAFVLMVYAMRSRAFQQTAGAL